MTLLTMFGLLYLETEAEYNCYQRGIIQKFNCRNNCRDQQPNIRESLGNLMEEGEDVLKDPEETRILKKNYRIH